MGALAPPITFALSWLFALIGWEAPGTDSATPDDEQALRWMLYLALGWTAAVGPLMHTVLARRTARLIGWETSGFQTRSASPISRRDRPRPQLRTRRHRDPDQRPRGADLAVRAAAGDRRNLSA